MSELSLSLVSCGQIPTISLLTSLWWIQEVERREGISGLHAYVKLENSGGMYG